MNHRDTETQRRKAEEDIFDLTGMEIPKGKAVHMFDGSGRELFWNGKELVAERPPMKKKP
jgi:hypothetical protein